jgi:hypothetical protein
MPGFGSFLEGLGETLPKIGEALTTPAIPELAERTPTSLIEAGKALPSQIAQRHEGVPFHGDPTLQAATRSTAAMPQDVGDWVRQKKQAALAFVQSDPDMPKDIARQLVDYRQNVDETNYLASKALQPVYSGLTRSPIEQAAGMWDYAVSADDLAQAKREGYDSIMKADDQGNVLHVPVAKWEAHTQKLQDFVNSDPQITDALAKRTALWKGVFQDMVGEGAIVPERELQDYTPMRHLTGIARGLATATGDETLVRRLSAVQSRGIAGGTRETNLAMLEHDVLRRYLKWKADRQLFTGLMADKTLNLTDKFKYGEPLPANLVRFDPGPGQIGYMKRPADMDFLSGAADVLHKDRYASGGFVIPKALKTALENLSPQDSQAEDVWRDAGRRAARWLTVYNPKNLSLNIGSDLATALMGMPGEKAQPLGILRWYGQTARGVVKAAVKGEPYMVKVGDKLQDVMALAREHGLMGTTFMSQVQGGGSVAPELEHLLPEGTVHHNPLTEFAGNVRQGFELAPRIAAGLEALDRTGDMSEFGRVGREITLNYGGGAPMASRMPLWKLLAPFIKYTGLATRRFANLAMTPGSRGRTLAAVVGVPFAAAMWNTHNDAFKAVEDALPDYERTGMHIIMHNPANPDEPLVDRQGKPVVLRFRYLITEEMMKQAGLGNLPSRLGRLASGQDTPGQFVAQTAKTAVGNIGSMITMPSLALDALSDTDRMGKHRDIGEKLMRTIPLAKIINEGWTNTKDYGPVAGAQRVAEEMAGASFAGVTRKGSHTLDATLMEHIQDLRTAKASYRSAIANSKSPTEVAKWKQKLTDSANELRRYVKATTQQRALNPAEVAATTTETGGLDEPAK